MIGNSITDPETGNPIDGVSVEKSSYQPPQAVIDLFSRCQTDYSTAWSLQHRPFDEFDGQSLLTRANLDQQTFGAFVGAVYNQTKNNWRWTGRKNTARNRIIGVLAQLLAAVLIPTVYAEDGAQNDAKDCAKVMRILIEEHLRRAQYEIKFLYFVLSALVNPAVFVQVEYVEKMQSVKMGMEDGSMSVQQAVDDLMSGLMLNVVPIDEILLGDFFTFNIQAQPFIVRIRRISYDVARGIYAGFHYDEVDEMVVDDSAPIETAKEGEPTPGQKMKPSGKKIMKDRFDYVQAGKTRVFLAGQEGQTLYDIAWTEGDRNMVQEATFFYRGEDLQVTFVGGVFMGNYDPKNPENIYNINPFIHRRMTQVGKKWGSMPVYPFAKSGAEPLDPQMRFAYYKSVAFKEYWDDATLNMMERLTVDGVHLDVMKPLLISGIAKFDGQVIAPGAVAAMPPEAKVSPYQLGPNLAAAMRERENQNASLSDSAISPILTGQLGGSLGKNQSATAVSIAAQNAKRNLSVITTMIADLVNQIGELSIDCIVMNTTVGQANEELPGAIGMTFSMMLARGKEHGKSVVHKVIYTDKYMGRTMTAEQKRAREWELWEEAGGGKKGAVKIWEVNPYQFARRRYTCTVDVDEMLDMSVGAVQSRKDKALAVLTSPMVAPFTDQQAVVEDYAIEPYGGNDPDRYKKKGNGAGDMMGMMGMDKPPVTPGQTGESAAPTVEGRVGLPTG